MDMVVPVGEPPERVVFSIVNSFPSRARVLPLPLGAGRRLGPDDIQVVVHHDHMSYQGEEPGRISVGVAQVCTNPVLVLSRLGPSLATDPSQLLTWKVGRAVQFAFNGIRCSGHLVDLATRLVNSAATPRAGQWFACNPEDAMDIDALAFLQSVGFVRPRDGDGARGVTFWALTPLGMARLEPVRMTFSPTPALADRGGPIEGKTTYELLGMLRELGWTWVSMKKASDLPAYRLYQIHAEYA